MRNKNSKVAATKLYLCKCDGVCITYSKIQYTYAMKLEKDQSIISIRVNVDLDGYKDSKYPERTYTSDLMERAVANFVEVVALPEMLIPHVPLAPDPVLVTVYEV